jgi:hypothetical protein
VLGQPTAALTQLGDLGVSAYLHGVFNTVRGFNSVLAGNKKIDVSDLGISLAAEEMADTRGMAKAVQSILNISGFRKLDKLGKNVNINSAFIKYQRAAQTQKGTEQLIQKYRSSFAPEQLAQVVQDFRGGKVTPLTKEVIWNELSDSQPISLSELPKFYLDNPNLRILYTLQTFTTKQLSLFYKEALRKMASGDPKEMAIGTKNAAKYIMLLTAANMGADKIKEAIRLRGPNHDTFSEKAIKSIWRTFGMSDYIIDNLKSGYVKDQLWGVASIFGGPITGALTMVNTSAKGITDPDLSWANSVKNLPMGSVIYMWLGGGIEEAKAREELRQEQKLSKEGL